ncbi:hypothetical protein AB0H92_27795 [Streptomyces phaeochromogenes]
MDTVTELASFLHDRWDDEERNIVLHELDCPVPHETGRTSRCYCPGPAQILARVDTHREISRHCEQRIRHEQDDGPCWPLDSTLAFQGYGDDHVMFSGRRVAAHLWRSTAHARVTCMSPSARTLRTSANRS